VKVPKLTCVSSVTWNVIAIVREAMRLHREEERETAQPRHFLKAVDGEATRPLASLHSGSEHGV